LVIYWLNNVIVSKVIPFFAFAACELKRYLPLLLLFFQTKCIAIKIIGSKFSNCVFRVSKRFKSIFLLSANTFKMYFMIAISLNKCFNQNYNF